MNFLEFAVWGAYLTSMGTYLAGAGFGSIIGWFYAIQGVVSMFMPLWESPNGFPTDLFEFYDAALKYYRQCL